MKVEIIMPNLTIPETISALWHPTKNLPLTLNDVTAGSGKKVWWICNNNHEWERTIKEQVRHRTCPYCSGTRVLQGFNDLATLNPEVASQWHLTLNGVLKPGQFSLRSNKKIWWQCDKGHEWETTIDKRTSRKHGCPVCANKKIEENINSITKTNSGLVKQWSAKNTVSPDDVSKGSNKIVNWICDKGHEWDASVRKRAILGQGCPYCSGNKVMSGFNDVKTLYPKIALEWSEENGKTAEDYTAGSESSVGWVCEKNHKWFSNINNRTLRNSRCPKCALSEAASKSEKTISDYIRSLGVEIESNTRTVVSPYELDVYIPSKKIAIEFNGVYWHTEKFKTKTYHHYKWKVCKEKGIQLIQIWEDDWNRNPELIKRMLAHKIKVTSESKVFARKTKAKIINNVQAENFLKQNHIQGFASGTHYLALESETKIVAVLVLKKEKDNTLNIIRYATSETVTGGFTKLLNFATKTYQPSTFVTFSDNTVSNGGLYENNGFIAVKELQPDYMYVVKSERHHKFGYRLKRFRNDPNLKFEEGLTEKQLAELNNIPRIWDAGKTKWVKKVKN